jgi:hypothetical protein
MIAKNETHKTATSVVTEQQPQKREGNYSQLLIFYINRSLLEHPESGLRYQQMNNMMSCTFR